MSMVTRFLSTVMAIVMAVAQLVPGAVAGSGQGSDGEFLSHDMVVPFDCSVDTLEMEYESSLPAEIEAQWQDRLMYFHRGMRGSDCWPIPYGNKTKNTLCYDGALTLCMILATHDYTMTIDSFYDGMVSKYGEAAATKGGHAMDGGKRTVWPTTFMRYCEEEYGVQSNVIEDEENALDLVKEALLNGHPVVCGDGRPMDFYTADGKSTYHCENGHTIMFYKYEDGIFYAKDTGIGGTMVPYPEEGGKIGLREWLGKTARGYIGLIEFYTPNEESPRYPDIDNPPTIAAID